MSNQPQQTPLVDLLRDVPTDFRAEWPSTFDEDGQAIGHSMAPVGRHCHDAADRINELEAQLAETWREIYRQRKALNNIADKALEALAGEEG